VRVLEALIENKVVSVPAQRFKRDRKGITRRGMRELQDSLLDGVHLLVEVPLVDH
jgi:hypothetical protein